MRPYFAIVADSFREALHSRVLWLLLALITIFLLLLTPLSYSQPLTKKFSRRDVVDSRAFAKRLVAAGRADQTSPQYAIYSQLSESLQEKITAIAKAANPDRESVRSVRKSIINEFNALVKKDDLFAEVPEDSLKLNSESKQLLAIASKDRTADQNQRLNRVIIERSFRRDLEPSPSKSVLLTYFGMPLGSALPLSGDNFEDAVKTVLMVFMDLIAAPVGVLVAILVTASIIPNLFDAGSVNLLFSKPIMRPILFLAKFFGGCWFVLINAAYLIGGLWLILGWRLHVWHPRLLYVIPILTFLFAVYYTVSSLAGVVWRNTIMAVVATIMFWAICFGVGLAHDAMDALLIQPNRIVKITPAGESMLSVTESGAVAAWNKDSNKWTSCFGGRGNEGAPSFALRNRLTGPVYDEANDRIVAVDQKWGQSKLLAGSVADEFDREELGSAPDGTLALDVAPNGDLILVDRESIARIEPVDKKQTADLNMFGFKYTLGPKRGAYKTISPKNFDASRATAVSIHPEDGSVLTYGGGKLSRYVRNSEGNYELATEKNVYESEDTADGEDDQTKAPDAVMAVGGSQIVLADENGVIRLISLDTLETDATFTPFPKLEPRFALATDGGNFFAVLFHNRELWLYDVGESKDISSRLAGQGKITAADFSGATSIFYSDRMDRVVECSLPNGEQVASREASLPLLNKVFFYVIKPIYEVFPKPGKLKETAGYFLVEQESMQANESDSLSAARVKLNPWPPVWHSAIFMLVMLAGSCLYIQYQEF